MRFLPSGCPVSAHLVSKPDAISPKGQWQCERFQQYKNSSGWSANCYRCSPYLLRRKDP